MLFWQWLDIFTKSISLSNQEYGLCLYDQDEEKIKKTEWCMSGQVQIEH